MIRAQTQASGQLVDLISRSWILMPMLGGVTAARSSNICNSIITLLRRLYIDEYLLGIYRWEEKGQTLVKYWQRFGPHMREIFSTWARVIGLIWQTNPWYIFW